MKLSTYLTFDGQAREAFTFYQQVLGGTLEMMTFAQAPEAEQFPAEHRDRIMHVCLTLDDYWLMASDTMPGMDCGSGTYEGIKGCSISLHPDSVAEGERLFAGLSAGGQVVMPMEKTFWAERFGMFTDRFGVSWMVNCEHP
ncbi:VOC family protein [Stutzerimonas degradans]|uniref:VOC family protein n=1 Tax=Stutzerimonas degradans TaxID=2968968 RepID=UPI00028C2694|nr:VOC family protein [Stutzerimonas degradans]EKM96555.1 glyoxalase family protein [Stutzerimonas degradans]NHC11752.1 VOC family protein [Stutzerimonas degradans]